jgi:hypothetical protein
MEFKEKLQKYNYIKWIDGDGCYWLDKEIYKIITKGDTPNRTEITTIKSGNFQALHHTLEKQQFIFVTDKYAKKHGYINENGEKVNN